MRCGCRTGGLTPHAPNLGFLGGYGGEVTATVRWAGRCEEGTAAGHGCPQRPRSCMWSEPWVRVVLGAEGGLRPKGMLGEHCRKVVSVTSQDRGDSTQPSSGPTARPVMPEACPESRDVPTGQGKARGWEEARSRPNLVDNRRVVCGARRALFSPKMLLISSGHLNPIIRTAVFLFIPPKPQATICKCSHEVPSVTYI